MAQKIWINSKVIKPQPNQGHRVKYRTYTEPGNDVDINFKARLGDERWQDNAVCFASLLGELNSHARKDVNRIQYILQDNDYKEKLDDQEKLDWITLAKRGLVLPDYVSEEAILNSKPVIKLENLNPSLLYIYLSSLRVIQENQSFVRAMIYLVAVYRMNFCAAWALASQLVITNSWHNVIEIGRSYCQKSKDDINDLEVGMNLIIGFQRYLKDPHKHDPRELIGKESYTYRTHQTISNLCDVSKKVKAGDLFEECVIKAINSETDKEAMKYLNALK